MSTDVAAAYHYYFPDLNVFAFRNNRKYVGLRVLTEHSFPAATMVHLSALAPHAQM